MLKHWKFCDSLDQHTLLIKGYRFDSAGMFFEFIDKNEKTSLKIKFPVDVESVYIRNIVDELSCNDQIGDLMFEAGIKDLCTFNPFFIQSIVKEETMMLLDSDRNLKTYQKYYMITDDFWIEVISSVEPQIQIDYQKHSC